MEELRNNKSGHMKFLQDRLKWFELNANPFEEARMHFYIKDAMEKLQKLDVDEEQIIIAYPDENGDVKFKLED